MSWVTLYQIRLYLRNSIWIVPVIGIFAGLATAALLHNIEVLYGWESEVTTNTGMAIIGTIASSMFSLLVLVSSAVLLAVQLATGQLSPRVISLVYRNPFRKIALAIFAFTFTFSVGVLARMDGSVPLLTGYLAAYGFLVNLALFLYFIDAVGKSLRPSSVVRVLAHLGRGVIRSVYPHELDQHHGPEPTVINDLDEQLSRIVGNRSDGVLLAFDLQGLISMAEQSNCLIEVVPEVGDFVAEGEPLFRIFGGGSDLTDKQLFGSVAFGTERTLEQDPLFAFRVMVDIASRALSPAVNDPTTAAIALDQIQNLLREVGGRYLAEGWATDRNGRVRVVYSTPNWEDFVNLAVTEIRHYGRESIQVTRRLRAMLEYLSDVLPKPRRPLLYKELDLVLNGSRRTFPDEEDQALAEISDFQGMGGSRETYSDRRALRRHEWDRSNAANNTAKSVGRA